LRALGESIKQKKLDAAQILKKEVTRNVKDQLGATVAEVVENMIL